jgi:hypothetical protein
MLAADWPEQREVLVDKHAGPHGASEREWT